jgi:3-(3-hydroxy-phenyl)propionate hydroxylase
VADGLVVRRADGTTLSIDDPRGVLLPWMGPARRVEVRPDRIVRSARR